MTVRAASAGARVRGSKAAGGSSSPRRPLITRQLTEYRALEFAPLRAGQKRVDRDRGEIYGVKIAGRSSPNRHQVNGVEGTDYTERAFREALPTYEGAKVNCNHPDRDPQTGKPVQKDRDADDRLGKTFGVYIEGGEVYGNLRLLRSHPMYERIMEAAESAGTEGDLSDCFALSHNAWGAGEPKNGRYVITKIDVHSVDLVADGGTNRSLFESEERRAMTTQCLTIRQVIESGLAAGRLQNEAGWKRLLEDDSYAPAMDTPAEAPPGAAGEEPDEMDHIFQAFKAAHGKEKMDLAKKLLALLKMCCKGEDEEEDVEESEEDEEPESREGTEDKDTGGEKDEKKKDAMESRELKQLRKEKAVRQLCESQDFFPTSLQLTALAGLKDDKDRATLIKEWKTSSSPTRRGPQSRSLHRDPAGETNLQETRVPKDADSQLSWLMG